MKVLKALVACSTLVLLMPCLAARANPVNSVNIVHDGFGAYSIAKIWGGGNSGLNVYAGVYMLDKTAGTGEGTIWPNGLIPSFCIELHQVAPEYTNTYEVEKPKDVYNSFIDAYIGTTKANYLRELWGRFYDPAWANGGSHTTQQNNNAEAFAAAVWEIIYENLPTTPAGWDVTADGTSGPKGFRCENIDSSKANLYLHSLNGCGPMADLRAFVNGCKQDYIVQVPEPATITMLGLSAVFGLIRRKRASA
jgi:hypothetical protein